MDSVPAAPSGAGTDAVTRVLAGVVCVVLLDATLLLLFYPARTDELWASPLHPPITAMVLGSAYAGGAYFFGRVMFGAPWTQVAAGLAGVVVFVWAAAVATVLDIGDFNRDTLQFVAWAALYVVTPLLVPWLLVRNRRRFGAAAGPPLPAALRTALLAGGIAVACAGALLVWEPQVAVDSWPWSLTPLTARITGAVVALYGTVWASVALQRTWAGIRIPLQAQAIGLAFLLLAVARDSAAVDWGNPLAAAVVALAAAMLAASAVLARRAA
jgi:hypothetical protein